MQIAKEREITMHANPVLRTKPTYLHLRGELTDRSQLVIPLERYYV